MSGLDMVAVCAMLPHVLEGPSSESIVLEIVEKVARRSGRDVMDLSPIGEIVDADALPRLIADGVTVSFSYEGHLVVVGSEGVTVTADS